MGWMDFLGGVGQAGLKAVPALEDRRRYDLEQAENRKRYEETLSQRALENALAERRQALQETEAGRTYDLQTAQGLRDEERLGLLRSAEERAQAEERLKQYAEGQRQGVMGLQQELFNNLGSGAVKPGTPEFLAAAGRAHLKPEDAAPDYYLGRREALQKALAGIARSPIPTSPDEQVRQAIAIAQSEYPEIQAYSRQLGDPMAMALGVDYQGPIDTMIQGALGRVPDILEQLKAGRYAPPAGPRNVPVPRIPLLDRSRAGGTPPAGGSGKGPF